MLFIYHLLPGKSYNLSRKSKNLFKRIEAGGIVGVVSSFTVMEYISVMKRFISSKIKRPITYQETTIMKKMLMDFIAKMGIFLYDSDSLTVDATGYCSLFTECEEFIEEHIPSKGADDKKWHTLNGPDALHLIFAIRTNSTYLATFDDDFKDVKGQIKVMNVREAF